MQIVREGLHAVELREAALRASFIASMVTAFGISGANGSAPSCATRVSSSRAASGHDPALKGRPSEMGDAHTR